MTVRGTGSRARRTADPALPRLAWRASTCPPRRCRRSAFLWAARSRWLLRHARRVILQQDLCHATHAGTRARLTEVAPGRNGNSAHVYSVHESSESTSATSLVRGLAGHRAEAQVHSRTALPTGPSGQPSSLTAGSPQSNQCRYRPEHSVFGNQRHIKAKSLGGQHPVERI